MSSEKTDRDAELCDMYLAGATLSACAEKFGISKPRAQQIVRKHGYATRLSQEEPRGAFLGVCLTPESKEALRVKAEEEGKTMSRLVSDAVEEMVK